MILMFALFAFLKGYSQLFKYNSGNSLFFQNWQKIRNYLQKKKKTQNKAWRGELTCPS